MNLGNYPHRYQCGHFFFGEGNIGECEQELDDSFHLYGFHTCGQFPAKKQSDDPQPIAALCP
jgi:hypothetical protein